jgi:hypothetical protein
MTVREIRGYLLEMYGTEVSPEFISKVTDQVQAEVVAWHLRMRLRRFVAERGDDLVREHAEALLRLACELLGREAGPLEERAIVLVGADQQY